MLEETEGTLDNDVLEDRSGRNVDGLALSSDNDDSTLADNAATKVDSTSDGEVVKLQDLGDGGDAGLEGRNLLEVVAELDERSRAEAVGVHHELAVAESVEVRLDKHEVRAGLDGQETATGHVDTVGVVEVTDGGTDGGLELDDADIGLALLVGRDALSVGNDLHGELVALDDALDGAEVHPDVVGVEVLELLDRLELVDVLLGNLGNLKETGLALVVNDGATLDVSLGLVGQLHDVLSARLDHVLEDVEVDDSAEVVGVGEEDNLNTTLEELVKDARVVERLEDVTVSGRVPVGDLRVGVLGGGEERVLEDTGELGLVEGEDVDVVALVLLDDVGGVLVGVEGVHQDEGNVDIVGAVEVLDLTDGKVEEGHAIADLNDGLGTDAAHGGTETTVKLEDGELVKELNRLGVAKAVVVDDLLGLGGRDLLPVDLVALGLVVQVAAEESEEVVHLGLETGLLLLVGDGVGEDIEGVAHLRCGNRGGGVLKSLFIVIAGQHSCSVKWSSRAHVGTVKRGGEGGGWRKQNIEVSSFSNEAPNAADSEGQLDV